MTDLVRQATALLEVLRATGHPGRVAHSLDQATTLVRGLVDSGEWSLGLDILLVCRPALRSKRERAECLLLEAECLIGSGRPRESLEVLSSLRSLLQDEQSIEETLLQGLVFTGWALWRMHKLSDARLTLEKAYGALLQRPDGVILGWCACNLGCLAWSLGEL